MRRVISIVLVTLLAAAPAVAQVLSYVGVYADQAGTQCNHAGHATNLSEAYVIVTSSLPLQEISFAAPVPASLGAYVGEFVPFPSTGDLQNGVTVNLPGCTNAPVVVGTIYYIGECSDGGGCCAWPTLPHPSSASGQTEFVDCDGVTRIGADAVITPIPTFTCCFTLDVLSPYEPFPEDGATDVATELELTWLLPDQRCGESIYFGDTPPPQMPHPTDDDVYFTSYDPGPLEPNTTYYWQVYLQCDLDYGVHGPVWTFTTGDGFVPTETTTWGHVKSLYEQ